MRIFKKEGKYSSFGEKTLPKADAERTRSATTDASSSSHADSHHGDASNGSSAGPSSSAGERRSSVILACVVADCTKPRVAKKNYCIEHVNNAAVNAELSEQSQALVEAIERKNTDKVTAILKEEKSADILFKPNAKGVTPLEQAFTGIQNSRACGEVMVNWLRNHCKELEAAKKQ